MRSMRDFFANKKLIFAGSLTAVIIGAGVTIAYAQNTTASNETSSATNNAAPIAATRVPLAHATEFSGLGIVPPVPSDQLIAADPTNAAQRADLVKQLDNEVAAGTMSRIGKDRVLKAFDDGTLILGPTDPVAIKPTNPNVSGATETLPVPHDTTISA